MSMDRAKRVINKPAHSETTSSEEGPRKRSKVVPGSISDDIVMLEAILDGREDHQGQGMDNHIDGSYVPQAGTSFEVQRQLQAHPELQPRTLLHTLTHTPTHNAVDNRMWQSQNNGLEEQHMQQQETLRQMLERHENNMALQQQKTLDSVKEMLERHENNMALQQQKTLDSVKEMLDRQLPQQQQRKNQQKAPKPLRLPMSTPSAVGEFEGISQDGYREVINYLVYIGGSNLKEMVTLSFKELFEDSVVTSYSWLGREPNKMCLASTKAAGAVHDAVMENSKIQKPTKKDIDDCLRVALRTAKERVRSKAIGTRNRQQEVPPRNSGAEQEVNINAD